MNLLSLATTRRVLTLGTALVLGLTVACSRPAPESAATTAPGLKILYNTEEESAEKSAAAQLLQAQLTKAGIPATLDPVGNSVFYKRVGDGDFQVALALWYLDYDDPEGFLTDFYSKGSFRLSKYESPAYDEAYLAGLSAPTSQAKEQSFLQANRLLSQDLPWVPLYSNTEVILLAAGMDGFRSNAYQYYDYRRVERPAIRVASNVELQTLDPALVYDLASKHVATQSYEGLVAMDDRLQIVPALAESWSASPAGDSITFQLRKGVRFSGPYGVVSARDVKASFERMLRQNSPYAYIFDHVKGVDEFKGNKAREVSGFRVVNANTFAIDLKQPFPTMLTWLLVPAAYVLPAALPEKFDFSKGSVGTGPFHLVSWDGTVASFESNSAYWGRTMEGRQLPFAKTLSLRIIKEVNAMLTAYQQGELDLLNVPVGLYREVLDANGALNAKYATSQLREVPLNNLKFLAFKMGTAPWGTDAALRKKVFDAIDRAGIASTLFLGKARPATSIVPQYQGRN
jgi:ABC-type transport system substrate-binding protein